MTSWDDLVERAEVDLAALEAAVDRGDWATVATIRWEPPPAPPAQGPTESQAARLDRHFERLVGMQRRVASRARDIGAELETGVHRRRAARAYVSGGAART